MSLVTYFRQVLRDHELRAAIRARDLPRVKAALADDGDPNAGRFKDRKSQPLVLALHTGDAAIFKELLDHGAEAGWGDSCDFRLVKDVGQRWEEAEYHAPSYLYEAINLGYEEIALVLANDPKISPVHSGLVHPSTLAPKTKSFCEFPKTPYELAKEKGMDRVAAVLVQHTAPLLAERAARQAEALNAQAAALDVQGQALRQQAKSLTGPAAAPS